MTIFRALSVSLVSLSSIGVLSLQCPADDPPVEPNVPMSKMTSDAVSTKALVQGSTRFALDLYSRIKGDGNLFFSPAGVSEALGICFEGARGATAAEMAKALGFPMAGANLGAEFQALREAGKSLNTDAVRFESANSLWSQLPLQEGFERDVRAVFDAEVSSVNFKSPSAREAIRAWVRAKTDGKAELPPESLSDPLLRLLVINTLLFKASWALQFNEEMTSEKPFERMDGTSITVPTMRKKSAFRYGSWEDLQILEMPYEGDGASAFILLPARSDSDLDDSTPSSSPLERLEESLTVGVLEKRLNGLSRTMLSVHLPRFSITSNLSLRQPLQTLGMSLPFQTDADFSGMTSADRLKIDQVLQDARIDFDEGGTEAAVVTVVTLVGRSISKQPKPPIPEFRADRPFMFLIRENTTGSILFMGRVTDPVETDPGSE